MFDPTTQRFTRPFTYRIWELNRRQRNRFTFQDLANVSGCRSVGWFNRLTLNDDPWEESRPPGSAEWPGMAQALHVDQEKLRWMIAREWLDLERDKRPSAAVSEIAPLVDGLSEEGVKSLMQCARWLTSMEAKAAAAGRG